MARLSYIETLLSSLEPKTRQALWRVIQHLATSLQFGVPTATGRALNFQQAFLTGTTPSTPGQEFVLPHGLESVPYLCLPVLPLGETGAKLLPLTVTRPADRRFVYVSSTVADAPFWLLVEGG